MPRRPAMRRTIGFLGIMLASAVLAHILFSAAVSAWIADRFQHRLFNVRNIADTSQWGPLTRLFVEGQAIDDPRPKVLLFGSSFTWGYAWQEDGIFSWHMQQALPEYQVLNLAVIGQDLTGTLSLECQLQEIRAPVESTLVEINLFNLQMKDMHDFSEFRCVSGPRYSALGGHINYYTYILHNPWGLEYLRAFWDNYNYRQADVEFAWNPLPESYFPRISDFRAQQQNLQALYTHSISLASSISERASTFVAPTLREGLDLSNYPADDIQEIADSFIEACEELQEGLCLDPGLDLPRENFSNLTHLNLQGHRELADYLVERLFPD